MLYHVPSYKWEAPQESGKGLKLDILMDPHLSCVTSRALDFPISTMSRLSSIGGRGAFPINIICEKPSKLKQKKKVVRTGVGVQSHGAWPTQVHNGLLPHLS